MIKIKIKSWKYLNIRTLIIIAYEDVLPFLINQVSYVLAMSYKHHLTRFVCLFGFLRPTREIFQSFGDVTVTHEELHKDLYSALMTIEQ